MTKLIDTSNRDGCSSTTDICVVGGAGHVGLGFSIVLASKGKRILVLDINTEAMDSIQQGNMPFLESDAEPMLKDALASKRLLFSSNVADIATSPTIIITIGTPIDEFLNPDMKGFIKCFEEMMPYLSDEHLLILRSTVYPGMTHWLEGFFHRKGLHPRIAFCPERIVEGHAIKELQTLPQIVSGTTLEAENDAAQLFSWIAPSIVRLKPMEAEFAKLFANAYRYIQFAITNQFYMMANSAGLDYYRILEGIKQDYPRLRDIPMAGYAAGPCLLKDTMQLTAFSNNLFNLGHSAMLINEGLPLYVVSQIEQKYHLHEKTVGILGMAFKADSDDPRSSLSYKLKKLLKLRAKCVLTTDPLVRGDADLVSLEEAIEQSDLLILAAPHSAYRQLRIQNKPVFDIWNFFGKGSQT
ncbi:MAG: nucleotide sugar dehydrogenase [Syntrophobacteraceae bacterium]